MLLESPYLSAVISKGSKAEKVTAVYALGSEFFSQSQPS